MNLCAIVATMLMVAFRCYGRFYRLRQKLCNDFRSGNSKLLMGQERPALRQQEALYKVSHGKDHAPVTFKCGGACMGQNLLYH